MVLVVRWARPEGSSCAARWEVEGKDLLLIPDLIRPTHETPCFKLPPCECVCVCVLSPETPYRVSSVRLNTFSSSGSYIPKHLVSIPLQSPEDRHSLTAEPTSMKPASQVKMAVAPNVVWVPIFFPLGGGGSSPQEITETHRPRWNISRKSALDSQSNVFNHILYYISSWWRNYQCISKCHRIKAKPRGDSFRWSDEI